MAEECAKHSQQIKSLEARQSKTEKDVDDLKEDRTENKVVVKQIADALPRLEKVMSEFQLTMVEIKDNLSHLNKSFDGLETRVGHIEGQMNFNVVSWLKNNFTNIVAGGAVAYIVVDKILELVLK